MFKAIVESSPLGIFGVNAAGNVTYCNLSAARLAYIDQSKLVGSKISTIFPEIELHEGRLAIPTSLSAWKMNLITVCSPKGDLRYYDVKVDHISEGEHKGTNVLTLSDVTARKRAWQTVEEQEKRWNLALQGSRIGVFESDLRTGLGSASDTWYQLLGLSKADENNSDEEWRKRVHPDDLDAVLEIDAKCIDGQIEQSEAKFRMKGGDGTWLWMKSVLRVTERDDQGKATRVLGTMTDISPLEAALELARSRRDELELLISNAPIAMSVFALDGTILLFNDSCQKLLGYTKNQLVRQNIGNLSGIGNTKEIKRSISDLVSGKSATSTTQTRITRPDGSVADLQISLSVLREGDVEQSQIIAQMLDITEQKRLATMKDDFVATVSHELRTPLASVYGAIKLLAQCAQFETGDKAKGLIEVAERNSDRLLEVVDDLLNFQKLNTGGLAVQMEPVSIAELISQAVIQHQDIAEKSGVTYSLKLPTNPIWADADAILLKQAISQLLSNATKFSSEKGSVEVRVERFNGACQISVTDNGRGVSTSFSKQIFKPFTQEADNLTRDKEGSGLGLAISKGLVEAMGGKIGYDSLPNVKTTFWIRLKLSRRSGIGRKTQTFSGNSGRPEGHALSG
ncbi:PAS domain S-box protein [Sulfitobacter noctilucae]|uniref:sensor histidine kinase n=1 Tax=Sulfitobacter noctilucae TaxID=1342302 RepID=UPI001378541D|nr:PAS domain S-box protein [Sulfitobacter noctilucae]